MWFLISSRLLLLSPVEGPVEQKDLGRLWKRDRVVLVGLKQLRDDTIQPGGPLLQSVLLLQSHFKVLLQTLHHAVVALTHPGRLLLKGKRKL